MRIIKAAGILIGEILSAAAGIAAASVVFSSFMVLEVEGCCMMPQLMPGEKVLVSLYDGAVFGDRKDLLPGDIVVCEAAFYEPDGQGQLQLCRITGVKDKWIEVKQENAHAESAAIIEKKEVLGKVIKTWERKNAS